MNKKVLFICEENSCLSQMAEGFLRKIDLEAVQVESAGICASPVHRLAVEVMSDIGIDISHHRSKVLSELKPIEVDLVITLFLSAEDFCKEHDVFARRLESSAKSSARMFLNQTQQQIYWHVPDPTKVEGTREQIRDAFVAARNLIAVYIQELVDSGVIPVTNKDPRDRKSILDLLDDAVIAHGATDRRIVHFNTSAECITGYKRTDVLGRSCCDVFSPDGLCASLCKFGADPLKSYPQKHETLPFITRNGTVRQLKRFSTRAQTSWENAAQIVVFLRDITEVSNLDGKIEGRTEFENLAGVSKNMHEVRTCIRQVSVFDYPVLIQGESGTGKELVAQAIHNQSRRKAAPFISINCRSLPDHILESELFGHVQDAFPGATRGRTGGFQLAEKGTVFLDEVADLSPVFQNKLLRVLEDMSFRQVGGEKLFRVNARIISSTTRDLRKMVENGTFREDLFYHLCVMPIHLSPLRDRVEDIPFLVNKIIKEINQETGKVLSGISQGAIEILIHYSWPENVRELVNVLRLAAMHCDDDQISMYHLPIQIRATIDNALKQELEAQDTWVHQHAFESRKRKLDPVVVKQALTTTKGNKVRAAKLLKVSRATLYRFLER